MSENNKQENDFLNEIQEKINKRSGGLYYNQKLKAIKKNLSITSFVVILIIILWALVNFIYQSISVDKEIKKDVRSVSKKNVYSPKDKSKFNIINSDFKENKAIPKQKYRYIFTLSPSFDLKNTKTLKMILKKYSKIEGKEFYIYQIPDVDIKNVLKIILNMKLNIKKESYKDLSNLYQISIKKELLEEEVK